MFKPLNLAGKGKVGLVLQQERAECGLACLAMISGYHGKAVDLHVLRRQFGSKHRGASFREIIPAASELQLVPRPVRLSIDELSDLQLPAMLHWQMNHFVVLTARRGNRFVILDPAMGKRLVSREEFGDAFTGVAMEFMPAPGYRRCRANRPPGLLRIASRFNRINRYLATILLLLCVSQLLALVPAVATQLLIDEVSLGRDRAWLYRALGGIGLVLLATLCIDALRGWIALYAGTRLAADSNICVLAHLLRLPVDFVNGRHLGDLMSKLQSLTPLREALVMHAVNAAVQVVVLVSTALLMLAYSPALALVSLLGAALTVLITLSLQPSIRRAHEQQLIHNAAQNSSLLETLRTYETVTAMALGPLRLAHWQSRFVKATNAGFRLGKIQLWRNAGTSLVTGIEQLAFLGFGLTGVVNKEVSIGVLFAFFSLRSRFTNAGVIAIDLMQKFSVLKVHTSRLADITEADPASDPLPGAIKKELDGRLATRRVNFRYADGPAVLTDLCIEIGSGQHVAITGPSGCGKSTLLKLLAGQVQPVSGLILIDDIERSAWNERALVEQTAVVMQNDQLFQGTIAENISAFDVVPDLGRVREAALLAECWTDIQAMPMQSETLLASAGAGLSGGQMQRLALARALYRRPRLLLLDEATSQLDVATEKRVLGNIASLGITVVSAAHRPHAIALATLEIDLSDQARLAVLEKTRRSKR